MMLCIPMGVYGDEKLAINFSVEKREREFLLCRRDLLLKEYGNYNSPDGIFLLSR